MDIDNSNLYQIKKFLNIAEQKTDIDDGITEEDVQDVITHEEFTEIDENNNEIIDGDEVTQLQQDIEEYEEEIAEEQEPNNDTKQEEMGFFSILKNIFTEVPLTTTNNIDIIPSLDPICADEIEDFDFTDNLEETQNTSQSEEITEATEQTEINPDIGTDEISETENPQEEREPSPQEKLLNKLKEGRVKANIEASTTGLGKNYTGYIRLSRGKENQEGEWPTELVMSLPDGIQGNMVLKHTGNGVYETSAKDRNFTIQLNEDGSVDVLAANVDDLKEKLEANQKLYAEIAAEKARKAAEEEERLKAAQTQVDTENSPNVQVEYTRKTVDGNYTYVRLSNGEEYYVDENGEKLSEDDMKKCIEADAKDIAGRMYEASRGIGYGLGTDEDKLDKSVSDIYSRAVFERVNYEIGRKSETYNRGDMTPVEALILDEKTHKAARKNFQALADSGVMTDREQGRMAYRELKYVIEGRTKTDSVNEVLGLIGDKPEVRKFVDEEMRIHPPKNHKVSKDDDSYIRGALRSDGFDAREVDMFDATLIEQQAYGEDEQEHVNNVTGRLVFEHSDKNNNEAMHVGLSSVNSEATMQYLNTRAAEENEKKGYQAFTDQAPLQTYIASKNTGSDGKINTGEVQACNTLLYKGEKPARIKAEEICYKAQNGDTSYIFSTNDREVYAEIENIVQTDGINGEYDIDKLYEEATTQNSDVDNMQMKANAVINGTTTMSDEELADFCVDLMHNIDSNRGSAGSSGANSRDWNLADNKTEQLRTILSRNPQIRELVEQRVNNGNFSYTSTYASASAFQDNGAPAQTIHEEHDTKSIYQDLLKNNNYYSNETVFLDENGQQITDPQQIENLKNANKASLSQLRDYVSQMEREFNMTVDSQGVLSGFVNDVSEFTGIGTDREDVRTAYTQARTLLNDLEMAAEGKLRDKNGNIISAQDLVNAKTKELQTQLAQTNGKYDQTIQYGKMIVVMAPVMGATIGASAAASAGVGALASTGVISASATGGVTIAATSIVGGAAAGGTMYGMNAIEYDTSHTGKTTAAKENNAEDSIVNGALTTLGIGVGGGSMQIGNNIQSTVQRGLLRYGMQAGSDVASGMVAEYVQTGDLSNEGTAENVLTGVFGNIIGAHDLGQTTVAHAADIPKIQTPEVKLQVDAASPRVDVASPQIKSLENDIRSLDGSIKQKKNELKIANKHGNGSQKLENELANLQANRAAKVAELDAMKNAPKAEVPVADQKLVQAEKAKVENPVAEAKPVQVEEPKAELPKVEANPAQAEQFKSDVTSVKYADAEQVKPLVQDLPTAEPPAVASQAEPQFTPQAETQVNKPKSQTYVKAQQDLQINPDEVVRWEKVQFDDGREIQVAVVKGKNGHEYYDTYNIKDNNGQSIDRAIYFGNNDELEQFVEIHGAKAAGVNPEKHERSLFERIFKKPEPGYNRKGELITDQTDPNFNEKVYNKAMYEAYSKQYGTRGQQTHAQSTETPRTETPSVERVHTKQQKTPAPEQPQVKAQSASDVIPQKPVIIDKNQAAVVTELPSSVNLKNISKSGVKDGGVFTQNGQLYIRNGNEAVALDISPETFKKLFPHESLNFEQGQGMQITGTKSTNTCWFLSTLENAYESPQGKKNVLKLFSEDSNGNISITFLDSRPITFKKGQTIDINGRGVSHSSDKGVALLEQAQAIHYAHLDSYKNGTDPVLARKLNHSEIDRVENALNDMKSSTNANSLWNAKSTKIADKTYIKSYDNPEAFINEIRTNGNSQNRKLQVQYEMHERAIKGYEVINGVEYVYISDPYDANLPPNCMSIDELMGKNPVLNWSDYGTPTAPELKITRSTTPSTKTEISAPTNAPLSNTAYTKSGLKIPDGYQITGTKIINGNECTIIKNSSGVEYIEKNGHWARIL